MKKISICLIILLLGALFSCKKTTLESISINEAPNKTTYIAGDLFDPTGMEVSANYDDGTKKIVTTFEYSNTPLSLSDTSVSISYTENSITKSTLVEIRVAEKIINASRPLITEQPKEYEVMVDDMVVLTVAATINDNGILTYQWYSNVENSSINGLKMDNQTTKTLVVDTSSGGIMYYYCVITNTNSGVNGEKEASNVSSVVAVSVIENHPELVPIIVSNLESKEVYVNQTLALSIVATSQIGSISYEWFYNTVNDLHGTPIIDNNKANLAIPTTNIGVMYYYCVITNTANGIYRRVISNIVAVEVKMVYHASVPVISKETADQNILVGEQTTLSLEATSDNGVLSYQWFKVNNPSTIGGDLLMLETNNTFNVPTTRIGIFYYYCVVTNTLVDNGDGGIKVASTTSKVYIVEIKEIIEVATPIIIADIQDVTISQGSIYILSVVAKITDAGILNYQWYQASSKEEEGSKIEGETSNTYEAPIDKIGDYYYYCIITNVNDIDSEINNKSIKSNVALIRVNNYINAIVPTIESQPQGITVISGEENSYTINLLASVPSGTLSYQWYINLFNLHNGKPIAGATSNILMVDTSNIGTRYYYCIITNTIEDNKDGGKKAASRISEIVAVKVEPLVDAKAPIMVSEPLDNSDVIGKTIRLSLEALSIDKGILEYQWYKINTSGELIIIEEAINNYYDLLLSDIGTEYYTCIVTNTNNEANGIKKVIIQSRVVVITTLEQLNANIPIIHKPLVGVTLEEGSSYILEVIASINDRGTLSYQWYSSIDFVTAGMPIASATSNVLMLDNLTTALYYYCVITNTNNDVSGIKIADAITNKVLVSVNPKVDNLKENIKSLVLAINNLPSIELITYKDNAAMVKYLINEYDKLSNSDKSLVLNYSKLTASLSKILELQETYISTVIYTRVSWPYPNEIIVNNPGTYTLSDGDVILNVPIFANSNLMFTHWQEASTSKIVTSLKEAFLISLYDNIQLIAMFKEIESTLVFNYIDSITAQTIYSVEVSKNYGLYQFDINKQAIIIKTSKYPVSYSYNGNTSIYTYDLSKEIDIITQLVETRSYIFTREDVYLWKGSFVLGDITEVFDGRETRLVVPVGASLNLEILDFDVEELRFDGINILHNNTVNVTVTSGANVAVDLIISSSSNAKVIFLYEPLDSIVIIKNSSDWDGILSSNDLKDIDRIFATSNQAYYEFHIDGSVFNLEEISNYAFNHNAGDLTYVSVVRVPTYNYLIVRFFDGSVALYTTIFSNLTLEENSLNNPLLGFVFQYFILYIDNNFNSVFEIDLQGFITEEKELWLSKETSVIISYDTKGAAKIGSTIMEKKDYNFGDYTLPIPRKTGYEFSGYSIVADGYAFNDETFAKLLTHIGVSITLHANYIEAIDTSNSDIMGMWESSQNGYSRYIYFDSNGTGIALETSFIDDPITYELMTFKYIQNDTNITIIVAGVSSTYQLIEILSSEGILHIDGLLGKDYEYSLVSNSEFIDFEMTDYSYSMEPIRVILPNHLTLGDFNSGENSVYYLKDSLLDKNIAIKNIINNESKIYRFASSEDLVFIHLNADLGVLANDIIYASAIDGIFIKALPTPIKENNIFIGWYNNNTLVSWSNINNFITSDHIYLNARYYQSDNIDYSDYDFIGEFVNTIYQSNCIITYSITFNSDGTYKYIFTKEYVSNEKEVYEYLGNYQYIEAGIKIITGDDHHLLENIDIRFANSNIIVIDNNNVLVKGNISKVDYSDYDFIGLYEVYIRKNNTDLERIITILNSDGTYSVVTNNKTSDIINQSNKGYYRLVEGNIVLIGLEYLSKVFILGANPNETYSHQFIGTWYAINMENSLFPYLKFTSNGLLIYSTSDNDLVTTNIHYEIDNINAIISLEDNIYIKCIASDSGMLVYVIDIMTDAIIYELHYVR